MSPSFSISAHFWRGIGGDKDFSLFWWRYRLGFLTVSIDKVSLYEAWRKLRDTAEQALLKLEDKYPPPKE